MGGVDPLMGTVVVSLLGGSCLDRMSAAGSGDDGDDDDDANCYCC